MPIATIVIIVCFLVIAYVGANILLTLAIAIISFSIAGVIGAGAYKMTTNTNGGCDLFNMKKCK